MRLPKRKSKTPGLSPGTLVYIGDKREGKPTITVMDYTPDALEEKAVDRIEDCVSFAQKESVTWIDISGIHDLHLIEALGTHFNLHPLVLEDVVNTEHRSKMEDYESYLFVVLKMLHAKVQDAPVEIEQVSVILGHGVVISLQEHQGDVFDPVRERIRKSKGRIRTQGPDYLAYALIDTIVDYYFHIFERIGERVEELQEAVLENPGPEILDDIHELKREMIILRKSIWPLREIVSALVRGESALISEDVGIFLRDVYDHTIQVIDTIETYRDMLSGMLDIYLSSVSNRMNEVMKVLTIIATIFIPLTFIAGIYGMNFKYMPELEWHGAYPALLIIMVTIFVGMLCWFKRKKWL